VVVFAAGVRCCSGGCANGGGEKLRCCDAVLQRLWWPATRWRDSDAVVADEMKRCGGGCHGDGRRGEN